MFKKAMKLYLDTFGNKPNITTRRVGLCRFH